MNLQVEAFHAVSAAEVRLGRFSRNTVDNYWAEVLKEEARQRRDAGPVSAPRRHSFRKRIRAMLAIWRHGQSSPRAAEALPIGTQSHRRACY